MAWSGDMLSSGSRDRLILQRDVRTPSVAPERRLVGHRQEVSGWKELLTELMMINNVRFVVSSGHQIISTWQVEEMIINYLCGVELLPHPCRHTQITLLLLRWVMIISSRSGFFSLHFKS